MYAEAAEAYAAALNDGTYGKRGALLTNRGKALAAVGDYTTAAQAFSAATQDASYATPFKAYLGLGNALFQSGDYANAGTAFRQAAIDGANPAPAAALGELGRCFIKLGRPADAVETYRTAIDFAGPRDDTRALNAGMGQALSAAGRPSDALDAFNAATADGIYQLTSEQADELARVQDSLAALSAQTAMATAPRPRWTLLPSIRSILRARPVSLCLIPRTPASLRCPSPRWSSRTVRIASRPRSVVAIAIRVSKSSSCCFCSF